MRRPQSQRALAWALRPVAKTAAAFALGEESLGSSAGWREVRPLLARVYAAQRSPQLDGDLVAELVLELGRAMGRARRARPAEDGRAG